MNTGFLLLLGAVLLLLPVQGVFADVAPPPEFLIALGGGALIVLGIFIAVVVLVSFLVIRAIKRRNAPKDEG